MDCLDLEAVLSLPQQYIFLLFSLFIMLLTSFSAFCQQTQLMKDGKNRLSFDHLLPHGFYYLLNYLIEL